MSNNSCSPCSTDILCDKMLSVERKIKEINKKICCIPEYQFQDEGIDIGTPQTVKFIDFTGDGITASFVGNKIIVDVPNSGVDLPNTNTNSSTANVLLSGTLGRNIQVNVRVSAVGGNIITIQPDGLYATATPYIFSTGLTNTANTITANLSTGVVGGQTAIGGAAAGNNLTLSSTSNATKGKILFGTSTYDEVNNRLGIGTITPASQFEIFTSGASTITSRMTATSGTTQLILDGQSNVFTMTGSNATVNLLSNNVTINLPSYSGIIQAPSSMPIVGSYNWIRLLHSHHNQVTGDGIGILSNQTFAPTSGTATFTTLSFSDNINQTGGANGITRSIYIAPGLTSAVDYRAIEISNNQNWAIYQSGVSAKSLFAGTLRFTGIPTFADEAAATTGGLITGDIYKTVTGELRIKL